ncbi:MAG: DUF4906 domain-containing protein [Bacteroidales bacterium]|nr:DUF4906 domain-containing protein [Bacteroidales bacterium]
MRRLVIKIFLFLTTALLWSACVKDRLVPPGFEEDGMVDVTINFGSPTGTEVSVDTKNELGVVRESNVFNMYLLIFEGNSDGSKKLYGHSFDGNNLNETSLSNYWTVNNMATTSSPATNGTLHIRTAKKTGCTIVAVANMNPNDLDISASLLSTIRTYGELKNIVATQVRSEVAANSGYFMMTGQVHNVNIDGTGSANDISNKTLTLRRLYAKVKFNVRIKKGAAISAFVPDKWELFNVPTCCYLLERTGADCDAADSPEKFFSTGAMGFESETLTTQSNDFYADGKTKVAIHGFSFYMMENRHAPAPGISGYADRERQAKNDQTTHSGYCTTTNGNFVYANQYSTYVVITGKLVMKTSASGNDNATLDATVRYVIHLGDFDDDWTDFNTERNHCYEYTININGAEDIRTEVENNDGGAGSYDEPEPGATGRVVVALEKFFDSDCHYSTQVISFHEGYMDPENISWYVETPFNPDGIGPEDVGDNLSQIDYKWVEFRLNSIDPSTGKYTDNRVRYKPYNYNWEDGTLMKNRTMYVNQLVDYLKAQKEKYDRGEENDFDADTGDGGAKISVTAFIDEYYYTKHPITGEYDPTLWKQVVNHPMRRLHILASSARSADGESTVIGSSFTIQQRSIQSIYAVQETADLHSAWGMEYTDDSYETGLAQYWRNKDPEDCGNTSKTNGRLNTLKLWGVLNPDGTENPEEKLWEEYLNLFGTNETAQLWSKNDAGSDGRDYKYLRYSCLSRNRDNNGNDIIDPDEIRWYMASDIQLIGVFMGAYGIEGDARLYQKTAAEQAGGGVTWRQHVIASNRYIFPPGSSELNSDEWRNSNKYPRVIWAEEGITGSNLNYSGAGQTPTFSTRCVRNLGYVMDGGVRKDITVAEAEDPTVEPDPYVIAVRKHMEDDGSVSDNYTEDYNDNVFYEFDCSRINLASIREPIDHELVGHDEFSKMACLPSKFVTAPLSTYEKFNNKTAYSFNGSTYNLTTYKGLNDYLDASFGGMDTEFSVCPSGYRLPNVREMAIIWNIVSAYTTKDSWDKTKKIGYLGNGDSNTVPARTHWSKGPEGSNKVSDAWGWGMMDNKILMAKPTSQHKIDKPRCIKDLYY